MLDLELDGVDDRADRDRTVKPEITQRVFVAAAARAAAARLRVETELSFERRMARIEAIYDELASVAPRRVAI